VGLRPEHLEPGGGTIEIEVGFVEALGADTVVHGRLPDGDTLAVRVDGSRMPRVSDRLGLGIAPHALHLFDTESGRRIEQ
jgi:sn-glycerol 3-phosphate transport system ATP-binding protein